MAHSTGLRHRTGFPLATFDYSISYRVRISHLAIIFAQFHLTSVLTEDSGPPVWHQSPKQSLEGKLGACQGVKTLDKRSLRAYLRSQWFSKTSFPLNLNLILKIHRWKPPAQVNLSKLPTSSFLSTYSYRLYWFFDIVPQTYSAITSAN